MPLTSLVFPDVEQMVINQILDEAEYQAATVKPGGDEFVSALPFAWVNRIGGVRTEGTWEGRRLFDEARISIDVYADSRVTATDAMARVRAAIEQMQNTSRDGGFVLRTWEETGPSVRPEEQNTNVVRIGMTVVLRVRPA
jgi:hypothetical protein